MRLLLIVEDARYRHCCSHHVTCEWPQAELVDAFATPATQGLLPPEFLAQGYDAVIVDQDWQGGAGLAWLRELAGRRGFAPMLFLADQADAHRARRRACLAPSRVLVQAAFSTRR